MTISELIEELKKYPSNMKVNIGVIDFTNDKMDQLTSSAKNLEDWKGELYIWGNDITD